MILVALTLAMQAPTGLPAWAYTYDLPAGPAVGPGGFGGGGFGGGGFGGGVPATPAGNAPAGNAPAGNAPAGTPRSGGLGGGSSAPAPAVKAGPPIRLGDLIPDFKGPSLALGDRLDDEFVARAVRRLDDFGSVLFTADDGTVETTGAQGGTRTSYLLDDRNRVQFGTSFGYVAPNDSRVRFDAARALIEKRFGVPISGSRKGNETLTLNWASPDGNARLDLDSNGPAQLWLRTTLARTSGPDRYYPPVPRDANGQTGGG